MEDNNKLEYTRYIQDIENELHYLYQKQNKLQLILRLYSYIGIVTAVVGIIYFAVSYYEVNLTANQRLALLMVGVGLVLSVIAKLYSEILKERDREKRVREKVLHRISNFVLDWASLERTIYSILDKNEKDVSKFGIKKNIRALYEQDIITDREFIDLERALDLRNRIVHGKVSTSYDEIEKYSNVIKEVIDKILVWSKNREKTV